MTKWPSGAPVFRDSRDDWNLIGVDFDPMRRGLFTVTNSGLGTCLSSFEHLRPLNADAVDMLAIAKAGR